MNIIVPPPTRESIAIKAMIAILGNKRLHSALVEVGVDVANTRRNRGEQVDSDISVANEIASLSYKLADAMIAQKNNLPESKPQ